MGLLGLLLEWLFPTREEPPHEDYHIDLYQKDGADMLSLLRWERGQRNYAFWLEVMERLMAGRLCATQVEQWSCIEKQEERRRTEITYCETFPMRYGQEHLLDSKTHTRLTDGWKEIFSVGTGMDRAMLDTKYFDYAEECYGPWNSATTVYALKELPVCKTLDEVRVYTKQPGLFSIYYDIDEDWLDMTLPDEETKQCVIKTIREIMTAHGKSLDEPEGHSMGFLEFLKWTFSKDAGDRRNGRSAADGGRLERAHFRQRGLRPDAFCRVSGKGIRLFVRQPDVCAGICAARLSYAF